MLPAVVSLIALLAVRSPAGPDLGPNVRIFHPGMEMAGIQRTCDEIHAAQERSEFGTSRHALLFMPGTYDIDLKVGYYTHVAGLGLSPQDVVITGGGVRVEADWTNRDALINFWRTCENLTVEPTRSGIMRWAVSQAAPLRRVHVKAPLVLHDGGAASGGFMADSKIDGTVTSGPQQQWFSRNCHWRQWDGGLWNMFFMGVRNAPRGEWPERPYTTVPNTPVIREKPFLFARKGGNLRVFVPGLRFQSVGCSWDGMKPAGMAIPIERFHIARENIDTAATINQALAANKHLLVTPGIYRLDESIRVTRPDTVVLGLGLPTLTPVNGTPAIEVSDVDGVKLAGLLLDAGPTTSPTLLRVGERNCHANHRRNPVFLHDIFCRVGGHGPASAECSVEINSSQVVGDHLWLWRADHGQGAAWSENPARNGLVVNGDQVILHGLFVEHYQEYQTLWNGQDGRVYFFQCEMPYDPPDPEVWNRGHGKGWPSYKVADHVDTHLAMGMGIYCHFLNPRVVAGSSIEAPRKPDVRFKNALNVRLSNRSGDTGILNVINDHGGEAAPRAIVTDYPPDR